MQRGDVRSIQRILALSVETLIRNGNADEAEEAIRQGRVVAEALGPVRKDLGDDAADAKEIEMRNQVLADAGLLDAPRPILLPSRVKS